MLFQDIGRRKVVADFTGGRLSSDGGVLLLSQVDKGMGIIRSVTRAFRDDRDPKLIEHSMEELLRQRVFGLALGYEDLNDHAELRRDPLIALCHDQLQPGLFAVGSNLQGQDDHHGSHRPVGSSRDHFGV